MRGSYLAVADAGVPDRILIGPRPISGGISRPVRTSNGCMPGPVETISSISIPTLSAAARREVPDAGVPARSGH